MSVTLTVAFVGAFIAGLAGLFPCAATAACDVVSVKTQKTCLRFSQNCLNVLMEQQL